MASRSATLIFFLVPSLPHQGNGVGVGSGGGGGPGKESSTQDVWEELKKPPRRGASAQGGAVVAVAAARLGHEGDGAAMLPPPAAVPFGDHGVWQSAIMQSPSKISYAEVMA
uniref:Uncharacterized protein n=1 Tax=Oryza meridionalis TaxID=40149 RepID=A0A0E0D803_9ORYZ